MGRALLAGAALPGARLAFEFVVRAGRMQSLPMQRPYEPPLVPARRGTGPSPFGPTPVDVIGAVKFVFDDLEWKSNVALGLVLMLIPVVGPIALSGWLCEVHQRLVRNHPRPVPKLDFADFVHYLGRGLVPFLVQLVMLLPIWLLLIVLYVGVGVGIAAGIMHGQPWVGLVVALFAMAFGSVCGLLYSVVLNAAQTRAELTESFGEALQLRALYDYLSTTWLQAILKGFLFSLVAFGIMLTGSLLCVGMYPAAIVVNIAAMHLRWQVYRYHVERGGQPIAIKEPQLLPSEALMRPSGMYTSG
jgi:hypothetical protein